MGPFLLHLCVRDAFAAGLWFPQNISCFRVGFMVYFQEERGGVLLLELYVSDAASEEKFPVEVRPASQHDFAETSFWQTNWTSAYAKQLPNKVALCRKDQGELLGLMSYALDTKGLAVEILYVESARHSNANLLHEGHAQKRYLGIAKALFAYAAQVSIEAGFDGVLVFKAKTTELLNYYIHEFGARQVGSYDPFRLVIWEDAAQRLLAAFGKELDG